MDLIVKDCYELDIDYQVQFLGIEVFPKPSYKKLSVSERSVNKVHYDNIFLLEPNHYYYVTFTEDFNSAKITAPLFLNGLIVSVNNNKMFLFNASQNIIYLQKGVKFGEVIVDGWKLTSFKNHEWYSRNNF